MDSEIVAIDPNTNELRSFQELSNRPKKDVKLQEVKVVVAAYAFDLMYFNGEVCSSAFLNPLSQSYFQMLLEEPFRIRRDLLRKEFPPIVPDSPFVARLAHMDSCESVDGRDAMDAFWEKALETKSEGLMIKVCIYRFV